MTAFDRRSAEGCIVTGTAVIADLTVVPTLRFELVSFVEGCSAADLLVVVLTSVVPTLDTLGLKLAAAAPELVFFRVCRSLTESVVMGSTVVVPILDTLGLDATTEPFAEGCIVVKFEAFIVVLLTDVARTLFGFKGFATVVELAEGCSDGDLEAAAGTLMLEVVAANELSSFGCFVVAEQVFIAVVASIPLGLAVADATTNLLSEVCIVALAAGSTLAPEVVATKEESSFGCTVAE